ncbi:MAG: double-strand break repair helicase AddA [Hyphomicrobiales bacterium]
MVEGGVMAESKTFTRTTEQLRASDPAHSAWVMANAGSGKTYVLVDRVVRLLLAGTAPAAILCLTFTKAAAAEMAERLSGLLAGWISLDDAALRQELAALGETEMTPARLARARRLFALAIETPGGLKIQTIHAFCEKLLQLFPAESGIAPGFAVLDDTARKDLLKKAYETALREAAEAGEASLALIDDGSIASGDRIDELAKAFFDGKAVFRAALDAGLALDDLDGALRQALGCGSTASLEGEVLALDRAAYALHGQALAAAPDHYKRNIGLMLREIAAAGDVAQTHAALTALYFTAKGEARKGGLYSTKTQESLPATAAFLDAEQARTDSLFQSHAKAQKIDATIALLQLLRRVWRNFSALKSQHAAYDFDDLIQRTAELLNGAQAAQWVLYKLDGGLSHILVDEAQDTNPVQWQIVKALAGEFFAGEGVEGRSGRSIFAVGDIKQSIYSFQGADTAAFVAAREHFTAQLAPFGGLERVDLKISYRTLPAILKMVDVVFAKGNPAAEGLLADGSDRGHESHRGHSERARGTFEIWPLFTRDEVEDDDGWKAPVDRPPENHPRLKLAKHVASTIKGWIGRRKHPSKPRAIEAGDILILLQSRNALFDALLAELRQAGIAVAGADRLTLQDNIAVKDILALMQFCLVPEDDLALACVLKSPLVSPALTDEDLLAFAPNRRGSLWEALVGHGGYAAQVETLAADIVAIGREGPHGFILRVLNRARAAMAARLGEEALDASNMLVDVALDFERQQGPSPAAFLHDFQGRSEDVKRELSRPDGQLRIMTVHGAKGLEADIVILPDAADLPGRQGGSGIFAIPGGGNLPPLLPLYNVPTAIAVADEKGWKDADKELAQKERQRLLYVAMTRAKDALYVGGIQGGKGVSDDCWYALIEKAFAGEAAHMLRPVEGGIRRHGDDPEDWAGGPAAAEQRQAGVTALPDFLRQAVPATVSDRAASVTRLAARTGTVMDRQAALRGLAVHRFFELARPGDAAGQAAVAARLKLEPSVAAALSALLNDPAHAPWFGPEAMAEAAIAGAVAGIGPVLGKLDRLAVTPDTVAVLDFKSGLRNGETFAAYTRQMALYAELLGLAHPGRTVKAALLWTRDGRLDVLESSDLAEALTQMRREQVGQPA